MSGHHPFSELTKNFPPERRARVAEKVQLLKQEMALAELRKARQQSQADLAARLQVHQPAIAKMEHRADMYVSNLRRFIEAMGGTLEIVAHFPEGSVRLLTSVRSKRKKPTTPRSTPVSGSAAQTRAIRLCERGLLCAPHC
jgi:Helix-turn-helix domain